MKTLILIIFLFSIQGLAQQICDNQALTDSGWSQHPTEEFSSIAAKLELETKNPGWVGDMETVFFSGSLEKFVSFKSLDNLATPDMEMFGDVAYYSDNESEALLEIRWYENGLKHFVLRKDIPCTLDSIPLAENALS